MSQFKLKDLWLLLKETFHEWNQDEPFRLSAVVAYYAIISLPALLVISVNIAGSFYEVNDVQQSLQENIGKILGAGVGQSIATMIEEGNDTGRSTFSQIVSIGVLIFGATGVFYQLQKSMNYVWEVKGDPKRGWKKLAKNRAFSFGMVIAVGFLLLVSLILSSLIGTLSHWIANNFPDFTVYIFYIINYVLTFLIITLLFALLFKYLPDVQIKWRVVWIGAAVTAILFIISEIILILYFQYFDTGSSYGTAGSLVVIMLWVAYTCMIIFFGAEFTQVYARKYREPIKPSEHAIRTADFERKVLRGEGRKKQQEDEGKHS